MAINVELRYSNGITYAGNDNVIHVKTSVGLIDGLLDSGKIKSTLLPSWVAGSMRFLMTWNGEVGGVGGSGSLNDVKTVVQNYVATHGGSMRGCYLVASATIVLEIPEGFSLNKEESGEDTTIENGDWLICLSEDGKTWGIINNTYQDATTAVKGVVKLATEANGTDGTLETVAMTPKATLAAINARAYSHPTHTAISISAAANETISGVTVNDKGHTTAFTKQTIRSGNETQNGLLQLATTAEAKAATEISKAASPARVKEMIDKFASIELVQSLPTDMSDHPAGKLIMLRV